MNNEITKVLSGISLRMIYFRGHHVMQCNNVSVFTWIYFCVIIMNNDESTLGFSLVHTPRFLLDAVPSIISLSIYKMSAKIIRHKNYSSKKIPYRKIILYFICLDILRSTFAFLY